MSFPPAIYGEKQETGRVGKNGGQGHDRSDSVFVTATILAVLFGFRIDQEQAIARSNVLERPAERFVGS